MQIVIDMSEFQAAVDRFQLLLEEEQGYAFMSFADSERKELRTALSEEKYKENNQAKVNSILAEEDWDCSKIGTGYYVNLMDGMYQKYSSNLVFLNHKSAFKKVASGKEQEYDQLVYDFFRTDDKDATIFEKLQKELGGSYDTLAYFFSLKGDPYLPISSGGFEKGLKKVGIDYPLAYRCSWENYKGYCEIIREVQLQLQEKLDPDATLWHAHSFIWICYYCFDEEKQKASSKMSKKNPKPSRVSELREDLNLEDALENGRYTETEPLTEPKPRSEPKFTNGHRVYKRNPQRAFNALSRAKFQCECGVGDSHASFNRRKNGKPYTEPHHLVPMSYSDRFECTLDTEANIVSLCSNCHNWIHYGEDAEILIKDLFEQRKDALKKVGIEITFDELRKMY